MAACTTTSQPAGDGWRGCQRMDGKGTLFRGGTCRRAGRCLPAARSRRRSGRSARHTRRSSHASPPLPRRWLCQEARPGQTHEGGPSPPSCLRAVCEGGRGGKGWPARASPDAGRVADAACMRAGAAPGHASGPDQRCFPSGSTLTRQQHHLASKHGRRWLAAVGRALQQHLAVLRQMQSNRGGGCTLLPPCPANANPHLNTLASQPTILLVSPCPLKSRPQDTMPTHEQQVLVRHRDWLRRVGRLRQHAARLQAQHARPALQLRQADVGAVRRKV